VTDLSDLDFTYPDAPAPNVGAAPRRKCRRHEWVTHREAEVGPWQTYTQCRRCQKRQDAAVSRRGRNNRSRGNAIEREVAAKLGLRRVGQFGGPDDVRGDLFAAQVKSGGRFPETFWRWLQAVPVDAGQTPLLVVTDAPGPGHRRRAVVILDLEHWAQLHGRTTEVEPTEDVA
jgi:hypothetical protein